MQNMADSGPIHKGTPSSNSSPQAEEGGRADRSFGFGRCGSVFRNVLLTLVDHESHVSAMESV
jgi:hypothetical protein